MVNLVGIGGQIASDEMLSLLKCPLQLSVAMLAKFAVMPAVSTICVAHSHPNPTHPGYWPVGVGVPCSTGLSSVSRCWPSSLSCLPCVLYTSLPYHPDPNSHTLWHRYIYRGRGTM